MPSAENPGSDPQDRPFDAPEAGTQQPQAPHGQQYGQQAQPYAPQAQQYAPHPEQPQPHLQQPQAHLEQPQPFPQQPQPPQPLAPQPQAQQAQPHPAHPHGHQPSPRADTPFVAEVKKSFSRDGIITLAVIAAATLGVALIGSTLLFLGGLTSGSGVEFSQAMTILLIGTGLVLGGGVQVDAGAGPLGEGAATISVFALGALAVVVLVTAIIVRYRSVPKDSPAPNAALQLGRAAVDSALIALVLALVSGLPRLSGSASLTGSDAIQVGTNPLRIFCTVFVLLLVTLYLAREIPRRKLLGIRDGGLALTLREGARFLAVQFSTFAVVGLIALVIIAIRMEAPLAILAGLPLLGNIAGFAAALASFGGVAGAASFTGSATAHAGDLLGGNAIWVHLAGLLMMIFAAVSIGLHRPRTGRFEVARVWQLPAVVLLAWVVLASGLLGIGATGAATGFVPLRGAVQLGLDWSVPFLMALVAALVSLGAEVLPLFLTRLSPGLLRAFASQKTISRWLAGQPIPPVAAPAAAPSTTVAADPAAGANAPWPAAMSFGSDTGAVPPLPQDHAAQATGQQTAPPPVAGTEPFETTAPPPPALASAAHPAALFPLPVRGPGAATSSPAGSPDAAPAAAGSPAAGSPAIESPSAGSPGAGAPPAIAPLQPSTKKGLLIGVFSVLGVVLLVVAGVIATAAINSTRDPAAEVREYLQLLADGQAEAATEMVDPGLRTADRELLTNEVLGSASKRIEIVEVQTIDRGASGASVSAELAIDGERFSRTFAVSAGPKEFLVLDTWKLEDALVVQGNISGSDAPAVALGTAEVKLESSDGAFTGSGSKSVYLYPGVYPVGGNGDDYFRVSTDELRALPEEVAGSSVSVHVEGEPTDKLKEEVLKAAQARATKCVQVPTNMDAACPYSVQSTKLSEMKIVSQPQGFERFDMSSFTTDQGVVGTRRNATSFDKDPKLSEDKFRMSGRIEFENGKPVVKDLSAGW
ncbi:hypothetical protein JD292_07685 [Leucobacter sp. CSA2]|uniref:Uncharacterized protein n=1 Tax=Leucobacter edaphi TaxID=2796472 RepID=A0A934UXF3_9MICO|nr:hypothetical protein [Leucobacter edaphi]MBK0421955.1 hypothetical protein [Leucobacter edaphi]